MKSDEIPHGCLNTMGQLRPFVLSCQEVRPESAAGKDQKRGHQQGIFPSRYLGSRAVRAPERSISAGSIWYRYVINRLNSIQKGKREGGCQQICRL